GGGAGRCRGRGGRGHHRDLSGEGEGEACRIVDFSRRIEARDAGGRWSTDAEVCTYGDGCVPELVVSEVRIAAHDAVPVRRGNRVVERCKYEGRTCQDVTSEAPKSKSSISGTGRRRGAKP